MVEVGFGPGYLYLESEHRNRGKSFTMETVPIAVFVAMMRFSSCTTTPQGKVDVRWLNADVRT